jgi:S-adenosyl-L-methionine hydrolase (adenosine-forming)
MAQPLIALLTDFGTRDHYVGVMKGVMKGICPDAAFIDITHEIPPQDVRAAAFTLRHSTAYFPPGTVFLVVVDPGVGTARYPVIAQIGEHVYIAPDNGVLSYLPEFADGTFRVIANPKFRLMNLSQTFHGRDVFAPAAAHYAAGRELAAFGDVLASPQTMPQPVLKITQERITGEVVYIDHFGNIVTSLGPVRRSGTDDNHLTLTGAGVSAVIDAERVQLRVAEHHKIAGIAFTYNDVDPGGLLVLLGSSGFLEISINQGNAARKLDIEPGDPVRVIGDITVKETE